MKNRFFTLSMMLMSIVFVNAQKQTNVTVTNATINTGIPDLDQDLNEINAMANTDIIQFTEEVAETFQVAQVQVTNLLNGGLQPAETVLAFETANITGKEVTTVANSYKKSKGKGWGVVAKELGIKPGSPEFHQLKGNVKKDKDKLKGEMNNGKKEEDNKDKDKNENKKDKTNNGKGSGKEKEVGKGKGKKK